jgi:hypothetical protein
LEIPRLKKPQMMLSLVLLNGKKIQTPVETIPGTGGKERFKKGHDRTIYLYRGRAFF